MNATRSLDRLLALGYTVSISRANDANTISIMREPSNPEKVSLGSLGLRVGRNKFLTTAVVTSGEQTGKALGVLVTCPQHLAPSDVPAHLERAINGLMDSCWKDGTA